MNIEDFRDYCLTKLDASEGTPFGEDTLVFKVGGKIFAIASLDDVPAHVNLKCDPERARLARSLRGGAAGLPHE